MEKDNELKQKAISGLFWQFGQKAASQIVSFVISVILARLLMPEEFGLVALAGMFTLFLGIFIECGFGSALIQKKDADDLDLNTIFWTQLSFSIIIYLIVYTISPYFANIFSIQKLTDVIRVLALGMIIGSIQSIQTVIVTRRMEFKTYFYAMMVGSVLSGCIGVYLAYNGWGVWALVVQHLSSSALNTLTVFWQVRWIPHFIFSFNRFKSLFSVSSKYLLTNIIGTAFGQLRGYTIGLKYTAADLAYYNRGEGVPKIIINNIDSSINTVLFPVFSKIQDDKLAVKNALRRSLKMSSYTVFPMLLGLAAIADNLVIALYTEKWISCIPFMQLFCISECFTILNTANLQALKGIGRINTILKLEIYKKPIMIAILIFTMYISPLAIATGMCIYGIYTMVINALPNKKYIDYNIVEQLKDVSINALLAMIMAAIVFMIGRIGIELHVKIILQVLTGAVLYISASELFRIESWQYVKKNIRLYIRKNK